jgi:hypothetical protein
MEDLQDTEYIHYQTSPQAGGIPAEVACKPSSLSTAEAAKSQRPPHI